MSAYATIQNWLNENRSDAFFPPLDEAGQSVFVEGRETAVFLFVPPEPPAEIEDAFYLYLPLVSLIGLRDDILLEYMIDLAEANMVGALPTGYRIFYDRDQKQVYLGGQFLPSGLDGPAFRQLTEDFVRYGRRQALLFSERLAELDRSVAEPGPQPPSSSGTSESFPPNFSIPIRV